MNLLWILLKFFFVCILIVISAFFSGSEAALFSLTDVKRKKIQEQGTKSSAILTQFWKKPGQLLSSIITANEITNIISTSLVTSLIISVLGRKWSGLSILFMTVTLLVFGEITPKTIAVCVADKWAVLCAYPLYIASKITYPIYTFLQWVANRIFLMLRLPASSEADSYTEEEFKTLLSISNVEGILESEEQEMIENVLDFSSTQVREIMTPRTEILAFKLEESIPHIISKIKKNPSSRIPVYSKTLDSIEGILYARDLLMATTAKETVELKELMQPAFFVPITQKIDELLRDFRKKKVHIAIVVDEYGGTAGLVTLEDLLEEIFGEIIDEHDTEEKMVRQIKERIYVVSALIDLDDFNKYFITDKPLSGANSLGGFLLSAFGRVPLRGERLKHGEFEFIIRRSKTTRITYVLVKLTSKRQTK